jgi:hypothetical protein
MVIALVQRVVSLRALVSKDRADSSKVGCSRQLVGGSSRLTSLLPTLNETRHLAAWWQAALGYCEREVRFTEGAPFGFG